MNVDYLPKTVVCVDDIVMWEPNGSSIEKKFQGVVIVGKDVRLNACLDIYRVMKISQKAGTW
jgi:hypothetical protein